MLLLKIYKKTIEYKACKLMSIIVTMIGCYVYGVISTTAALAEVWSLAAVSLDRALAIYHPLNPYKRFTKSQVIVAIYIEWEP